ncbi:hypothetical protein CRD20_01845 [Corynebacterium sp. LK33]|nr:hypothetical protein [Corynebacterium sp. LK33]
MTEPTPTNVYQAVYDGLARVAFLHCFPSMPLPAPDVIADLTVHDIHRACREFAQSTGSETADVLQAVLRAALVATESQPQFTVLDGHSIPDIV